MTAAEDGRASMSPAWFEALYASDPDPWRFATSPYEAAKYDDTLASLGDRGLKVGAGMAERLGLANADLPWHAIRLRPARLAAGLGIMLGLAATFTIAIVALAQVVHGIGLAAGAARTLAIVVLLSFGLVLLIPALTERVQAPLSRLARFGPRTRGTGFWSGLAVGAALGFVCTPCAGPILAAVIPVSSTTGPTIRVAVVALAYALGLSAVMLVYALGSRAVRVVQAPMLDSNAPRLGREQRIPSAAVAVVRRHSDHAGVVPHAVGVDLGEWNAAMTREHAVRA